MVFRHSVILVLIQATVGEGRSIALAGSLSTTTTMAATSTSVVAVVFAAFIVAVYAASVCATKGARADTDDDFLARDRAATVGMEGNPLYKPKGATSSVEELANRQEAQQKGRAAAEADDDEDAVADRRTTISNGSAAPRSMFSMDSGAPAWLHMGMTKRESIEMLNADSTPESGMFLIRAKARVAGQYVLDLGVLENDTLVLEHYAILRSAATNEFLINDRASKTGARTVESLVAELHGSTNLIRCSLVRGVGKPVGNAGATPAARRGSELSANDLSLNTDANNA